MTIKAQNATFKPKALSTQLCPLSHVNVAEPANVPSALSNPKRSQAM